MADGDTRVDQEQSIAYIRRTGLVADKCILDVIDAAVLTGQYRDGMGRLWDFRQPALSAFDSDTIRQTAAKSLKYSAGINDVFVDHGGLTDGQTDG